MYQSLTTTRGFRYHYLSIKAEADKPTLLFLHGFPSSSHEWHHQVDYFRERGYGLLVPDMLGYGGTDKPLDPAAFAHAPIARDIVDIVDAEAPSHGVCVIGHDWGSAIASYLANNYTDRFSAFAFISVPYVAPENFKPLEEVIKIQKSIFGHPVMGYWTFFIKDGAARVIEEHMDSFLDVFYPADPEIWKTYINIPGELEPFLTEDRRLGTAPYLPTAYYQRLKNMLALGGLAGPLNWYKCAVQGFNDPGTVPETEDLMLKKPTFFARARFDHVAIEAWTASSMQKYVPAKLLTQKSYDTGHWLQLQAPDQLNMDLEEWIKTAITNVRLTQ